MQRCHPNGDFVIKRKNHETKWNDHPLNRFISWSTQHALPLYKLLRKKVSFEWTLECEEAFCQPSEELVAGVVRMDKPIVAPPTNKTTSKLFMIWIKGTKKDA
jgi:hypothetical protein